MSDEVKSRMIGARLDAVCFIPTDDNKRVLRGVIYSVPKL